MLEGYTRARLRRGVTERIRSGTMVTGVTYRHPGVLVKTVTTLDVLSGGRANLGIGAAWNEEEHRGLGVPYPPLAERFERLEETLQIAHQMWSRRRQPVRRGALPPRAAAELPARAVAGRTRRSWSVAAARRRRCGSWPSTPTPATSSRWASTGSDRSSTCSRPIATGRAAPTPRSRRPRWDGCRCPAAAATGPCRSTRPCSGSVSSAGIGVDQAIVSMPGVHDPASFELVPALVEQLASITPSGR